MLKKVFNWSEVHLSEVTFYKIHTLVLPSPSSVNKTGIEKLPCYYLVVLEEWTRLPYIISNVCIATLVYKHLRYYTLEISDTNGEKRGKYFLFQSIAIAIHTLNYPILFGYLGDLAKFSKILYKHIILSEHSHFISHLVMISVLL